MSSATARSRSTTTKCAVLDMQSPANITELRRFFGMINQMAKFLPNLAAETAPLRSLLSSKNAWLLDTQHETAFVKVKHILCSSTLLTLYDTTRNTKVSADSSSFGLGAVISQEVDGNWQPIAYASRSLSVTEQRYAQVEKEALAAAWACTKFQDFLIGINFTLETDHKPLLALLGTKPLCDLPPRIQRIRMRLMRFAYNVSYTPGKDLFTADTLSRAPSSTPTSHDAEFDEEITSYVNVVLKSLPVTDTRLKQIQSAQAEDEICEQLIHYCGQGWPTATVSPLLHPYWCHRDNLTVQDNILMYGARLVIPTAMQREILGCIHESHQGLTKCRQRAAQSVWWPGLSRQLQLIENCVVCCEKASAHPEPLMPTEFPTYP